MTSFNARAQFRILRTCRLSIGTGRSAEKALSLRHVYWYADLVLAHHCRVRHDRRPDTHHPFQVRKGETGGELYERTFRNHREAILETFGIEIKCDRSLGYYIANSDDLEGDGIRQ